MESPWDLFALTRAHPHLWYIIDTLRWWWGPGPGPRSVGPGPRLFSRTFFTDFFHGPFNGTLKDFLWKNVVYFWTDLFSFSSKTFFRHPFFSISSKILENLHTGQSLNLIPISRERHISGYIETRNRTKNRVFRPIYEK